ncbi:TonB-dependent receptor family protein [Marilutibacter alkalisoli]|nr:TonB-dependent receptor [Lysobacter alkalisoli]
MLASVSGLPLSLQAQSVDDAATLDTVRVLGETRPLSAFPGAVTVVEGEALHRGQQQVSLAEPLARVPGIAVLDRHNYAQDLQIQSRGFGARSTFGVRGLRLLVDGIPATAADGQGQAATFPLGSLDRIEILRGPLALQYGNAAGGVIVGHTDLSLDPRTGVEAWMDDNDSWRLAARAGGGDQTLRWRVGGSRFDSDGYRPHSAAERMQGEVVAEWMPRTDQRLRLVANSLVQPWTEDPLGLTREDWELDPHATAPAALLFNTRKKIDNHQFGLRWERDTTAGGSWVGGHAIDRDIVQFLAIPEGAQQAPGSGGGVIDVARRSYGFDAGHRWRWQATSLAVGVEVSRLDEAREGYENFVVAPDGEVVRGVRGRPRRDEDNRIETREVYAIADRRFAGDWTVLGGARLAWMDFVSVDHYVAPGNGDDSGRLDYREHALSLGASRAFAGGGSDDETFNGEVFASFGRGFETPTVTELAYRPDGSAGFNTALVPARYHSGELGLRWRVAGHEATATAYRVEGEDEIVPAQSQGGRASFANAGRTRRNGVELSLAGDFGGHWSYALVGNWVDARFIRDFSYAIVRGTDAETRTVPAGNRVPGIARASGFGELAWRRADDRLGAAMEAHVAAAVPVDDLNSDSAPGQARLALRFDWQASGGWHGFARIDNLFDRDYIGSVIVNEGNGRFFEPGPGRTFTLGLGWQMH